MQKHTVCGRAAALVLAVLWGMGAGGCDGSGAGKELATVRSLVIMTWNVQALFDGTESGNEYGEYREAAGWSAEKYAGRVNGIAKAIEAAAAGGQPPDIIALQEIESAGVLRDLAEALAERGYGWTHFAGSPGMSLGLGVLSRFPLDGTRVHAVSINGSAAPRPMLEARVSAGGAALTLFVCHWKSKLGGEDITEAARRASARIILRRIRELAEHEPDMPVIVMGDLNENYDEFFRRNGAVTSALLPDDPRSAELFHLNEIDGEDPDAALLVSALQEDFIILSENKPPQARYFPPQAVALYSPWAGELANGSYYYKDEWETIDHFLLSAQLFDGTGWEFMDGARADSAPFVNAAGYPAAYNPRTGSGLSDHLPLLLFLEYRGP